MRLCLNIFLHLTLCFFHYYFENVFVDFRIYCGPKVTVFRIKIELDTVGGGGGASHQIIYILKPMRKCNDKLPCDYILSALGIYERLFQPMSHGDTSCADLLVLILKTQKIAFACLHQSLT